ncbi:MAG TPA: hypothetical protein VHX44_20125 [Planctomycetota bacterium]|nr:hypothetical protein [Planctomycetota bacterium]
MPTSIRFPDRRGTCVLVFIVAMGMAPTGSSQDGQAAPDVVERCNRKDPAFAPVADPVADEAMAQLLMALPGQMADPEWARLCRLPSFGVQAVGARGARYFDKYDSHFVAASWFWYIQLKGQGTAEEVGRVAYLMKTMSWYESKIGYASGFTNRAKGDSLRFPLQAAGFVDTEDVMQVGNPADLPIHEKVEEMIALHYTNAKKIAKLVPETYTHRNISGLQSIFYGTGWFAYKYFTAGRVPREGVRRYNGNTSVDAWNGKQHRDNYVDSVTVLFKTGVARFSASGEELLLVKP